jgi:exonuclease III
MHNLRIVVWNVNSIKSKKSELSNFLSINNLDIVAISETKLTPKHTFSMPDYCVYHADWNHFVGGVMLLVKNNVRRDQFMLPNVVNLETIAVCLYLQNSIILLFVSRYNAPDSPVPHFDLDSLFSSFVLCCSSQ